MTGDTATYATLRLVLVVVAIIIIINAIWSLWLIRSVNTETCDCTGINDNQKIGATIFHAMMLVLGVVILVYVTYLTTCLSKVTRPDSTFVKYDRTRERFKRNSV